MKNNKDILNEWDEYISNYPKIRFNEAKEIYIELSNCTDTKLKNNMKDKLIVNTLYVVVSFIKKNGLIYLNSSSYDMSDIISVCNEIWINKINSGKLLHVKSFGEMFDYEFYNKLSEGLNITKISIREDTMLDTHLFIDLLIDYIELKKDDSEFNYDKLIKYMKTNPKYQNVFSYIYYFYNKNIDFCILFNGIIESFELEDNDLNISKTNLNKLKYIIISNGLEYLRKDINRVVCNDSTDIWLDKYCKAKICEIIFQSDRFNDTQKNILAKRFGIFDGKRRTLEDIATDYDLTRERIRQKESKILRMLRNPMFVEKIKNYM